MIDKLDVTQADDLRPWGYAPGDYTFTCCDCPDPVKWGSQYYGTGAKRSWRCRPHAEAARNGRQPVDDHGNCDRGAEFSKDASPCRETHLPDCPAAADHGPMGDFPDGTPMRSATWGEWRGQVKAAFAAMPDTASLQAEVERLKRDADAGWKFKNDADKENARLQAQIATLRAAGNALADDMWAIAEGNLGEASWQANYDRIRTKASEALTAWSKTCGE